MLCRVAIRPCMELQALVSTGSPLIVTEIASAASSYPAMSKYSIETIEMSAKRPVGLSTVSTTIDTCLAREYPVLLVTCTCALPASTRSNVSNTTTLADDSMANTTPTPNE